MFDIMEDPCAEHHVPKQTSPIALIRSVASASAIGISSLSHALVILCMKGL